MATVRINRDSQGFFLWPRGLPEFVPGSPLTVAENVLAHGTGALNIDGCRVDATGDAQLAEKYASVQNAVRRENNVYGSDSRDRAGAAPHQAGRWPANLIHDGSEEVTGLFPENRPGATSNSRTAKGNAVYGEQNEQVKTIGRCDTGSAARFFYCAKASKRDRDAGNNHPTVKPTDLMRYLCRLVTPPGGVVLDPFMGSGSTGRGAIAEGFQFIGIELDPEYAAIAEARIKVVQLGLSLGGAA
jgi:site-specific DNA-methyltransferase (adenine-specific)